MAKKKFNLLRQSIFLIKSVSFLVYTCNKNRQKFNLQLTTQLLKDKLEVNVFYFHANKH